MRFEAQGSTCITYKRFSVELKSSSLEKNAKKTVEAKLAVHKKAKKFYNKLAAIMSLCKGETDVEVITFNLSKTCFCHLYLFKKCTTDNCG